MIRYMAAKNKINIGKSWSCMEWSEKKLSWGIWVSTDTVDKRYKRKIKAKS